MKVVNVVVSGSLRKFVKLLFTSDRMVIFARFWCKSVISNRVFYSTIISFVGILVIFFKMFSVLKNLQSFLILNNF